MELTDGTQLHCAKFAVVKNEVTVTLLAGQTVKFPLSGLSQMLTNANLDKNRKDWAEVLAQDLALARRASQDQRRRA